MPNIGKNVCNLKLMHGNEIIFSFSQFIGKNIILYFYPKDNTPSCTQEAKDFTSLKSEFDNLNTIIICRQDIYVRLGRYPTIYIYWVALF